MDCPNDRYVNDEAICQAVVAMLARIGIKAKLNAMPKAKYFEKAGATQKYDSSFNLLGWTPGSFDSHNVLLNITGCRDGKSSGSFNYGGYCNPKVDELAGKIIGENDPTKRDEMIAQAFASSRRGRHHSPSSASLNGRVEKGQDCPARG